jgi:hypothetical protein
MRWSSLLLCLLLTLLPAPSRAEGVAPDQFSVVAPEVVLNQPLLARTLCTWEPTKERRWEVRNLTDHAITFTWHVPEIGRSRTMTLTAGAQTQVTVPAKPGLLTLRLMVNGQVVTNSPNWGTRCATQQPGRSLTWQKAPPKAPTRPAKPAPGRSLTWQKAPPKAPTRPAQPAPGRRLTWQAGQPIVKVTPLCYRHSGQRRWQVENLTDSPLTLTMEIESTPRGQLVLAPRGRTELALEAATPPNRLRLFKDGQLVAESPNPDTACP